MFIKTTQTKTTLITSATLTLLAFSLMATTFSTNANADSIAGDIAVDIIGSALYNETRRHVDPDDDDDDDYGTSSWERHVDRCHDAYSTYSESSDTYIGYDGYRHTCRK